MDDWFTTKIEELGYGCIYIPIPWSGGVMGSLGVVSKLEFMLSDILYGVEMHILPIDRRRVASENLFEVDIVEITDDFESYDGISLVYSIPVGNGWSVRDVIEALKKYSDMIEKWIPGLDFYTAPLSRPEKMVPRNGKLVVQIRESDWDDQAPG